MSEERSLQGIVYFLTTMAALPAPTRAGENYEL